MANDIVDSDEEVSGSDEDEEFTGERVTAKEFTNRHFHTAKAGLQIVALELVEPSELVVLDKASRELGESMLASNQAGAERSGAVCRKAAAALREARGGSEEFRDERKRSSKASHGLQSWRPDFGSGRVPPARLPRKIRPKAKASQEDQGPHPLEAELELPVELDNCSELEPPSEILEKKGIGDAATHRGDFSGALDAYEECLAMAGTPDQDSNDGVVPNSAVCLIDASLHAKIFSNSALCTLKLAGMQPTISHALRMMRRTLRLSDRAVELDFTNSKAHYRRGCALEALERYDEASQAYERASRFEPGDLLINEAFDRSCRYIEAQMDPKMVDDAKVFLKRLQKMQDRVKRPGGGQPLGRKSKRVAAACLLSACACCRADVGSAARFARPCGHGPFCTDCQEWIASEGKGLELCPVCRRQPRAHPGSGVIEDWAFDEMPEVDLRKSLSSVVGQMHQESSLSVGDDGVKEASKREAGTPASCGLSAEAREVSFAAGSEEGECVQFESCSATGVTDLCLDALD